MKMPIDVVLEGLDAHDCQPQPAGDGAYKALCPLHPDKNPSLSIKSGDGGNALVHCHACAPERGDPSRNEWLRRFCEAIGLTPDALAPAKSSQSTGRITATYDYHDADGALLFQVVRFEPKGFRQRRPDGNGGWLWNLDGVPRVPYRLPGLLAADKSAWVLVVEGEKDADRLRALEAVATTNPMGAGKWRDEYSETLRDRRVCILCDNDDAGRDHAKTVARSLNSVAKEVRVLDLAPTDDEFPDKGDVSDWLDRGGTLERLLELVERTPNGEPNETGDDDENQTSAGEAQSSSNAKVMAKIREEVELFHADDGRCYASFEVNGHRETRALESTTFKHWVACRFFRETGRYPSANALTDMINGLKGTALFDGPQINVYVRLAEHEGKVYLDLCNESWEAIEIAPDGWRVVDRPPVHFVRANGSQALPCPEPGGTLDELRPYLNVARDDAAWILIMSYLVGALSPHGPYPILILQGEQGAAKSTVARMLRSLIDPYKPALRSLPREERDLMIAARNSRVLAFDNLSGLRPHDSDALCRLISGIGLGARELYTDADEVLFDAKRPVILNGIPELAERPDLRDRAIVVCLEAIPDEERRSEAELRDGFGTIRAQMLGCLCDAVSMALQRRESVQLDKLPRMADFVKWVSAAEPALPWEEGQFLATYEANRREAAVEAAETDEIVQAIVQLLKGKSSWIGRATELHHDLHQFKPGGRSGPSDWPRNAQALASKLKRITPLLRAVEIKVDKSRTREKRLIVLEWIGNPKKIVTPVTPVTESPDADQVPVDPNDRGDARDACDDDLTLLHHAAAEQAADPPEPPPARGREVIEL